MASQGSLIHLGDSAVAICTTASNTTTKVVSFIGFTYTNGSSIWVYFTHRNVAWSPKLNINSLGAKDILLPNGASLDGTCESAYRVSGMCYFIYYNGAFFLMHHKVNYQFDGQSDFYGHFYSSLELCSITHTDSAYNTGYAIAWNTTTANKCLQIYRDFNCFVTNITYTVTNVSSSNREAGVLYLDINEATPTGSGSKIYEIADFPHSAGGFDSQETKSGTQGPLLSVKNMQWGEHTSQSASGLWGSPYYFPAATSATETIDFSSLTHLGYWYNNQGTSGGSFSTTLSITLSFKDLYEQEHV